MTTPTVSALMIVRDEPADQLRQALASIRPLCSELVLVDTGSVESNVDVARQSDVDVFESYSGCNDEHGEMIDFAAARNFALSLSHGDYIVWLDSDDVVRGKGGAPEPDALLKLCEPDLAVSFLYEYTPNKPDWVWTSRLAPRAYAEWSYPIHELQLRLYASPLVTDGKIAARHIRSDALVWKHHHKAYAATRRTRRNLRICRHWENDPRYASDARFNYYYGQSLQMAGERQEAIERFEKAMRLHQPGDEYRFVMCRELVRLSERLEDKIRWAQQAVLERPTWPDGYFLLARQYWALCGQTNLRVHAEAAVETIRRGWAQPAPTGALLWGTDEDEGKYNIHFVYNEACNFVGDMAAAIASCVAALAVRYDPALASNLHLYKAHVAKTRILAAQEELRALRGQGFAGADAIAAECLDGVRAAPRVTPSGPRRVAFVLGEQWVPWTPDATETLGGSELAVVDVTKRLAKAGYEVLVYSAPGIAQPRVYDGVQYTGKPRPTAEDRFDVMVGWRALDCLSKGQATKVCLWLHRFALDARPRARARAHGDLSDALALPLHGPGAGRRARDCGHRLRHHARGIRRRRRGIQGPRARPGQGRLVE